MRVSVSSLAERDLEAIGDYIAEDNPSRALSFIEELRAQCAAIANAPQAYRARPELGEGIRSCAHGSYVIFFTATKSRLTIVRILHGAMDIPAQFGGMQEEVSQTSAKGKVDPNDSFIGSDANSGDVARHTGRLPRERFRRKG